MLIRRYTAKYPKPTLHLTYDRSLLPSRWSKNTVDVFFPTDYEGSAKSPLPVYFDIHGGAFIVGETTIGMVVQRIFFPSSFLQDFSTQLCDVLLLTKDTHRMTHG